MLASKVTLTYCRVNNFCFSSNSDKFLTPKFKSKLLKLVIVSYSMLILLEHQEGGKGFISKINVSVLKEKQKNYILQLISCTRISSKWTNHLKVQRKP